MSGRGGAAAPRLVTPLFVRITLTSFAYFASYGMTLPVLPKFVDGPLGGGGLEVGLVGSAFAFSSIVLRPIAGRVGDARGRGILMAGGAAIVATATLPTGYAGAVWLAFLFRFSAGFGEAGFFTGAASAINDLAPEERRGEAVSYFTLSLYSGLALGPLAGEAIMKAAGFKAAFLAAGALAGVAALATLRLPDTRPDKDGPQGRGPIFHRAAFGPGSIMTTSVIGFAGYAALMPLYARNLGMDAAPIFLAYSVVILVLRLAGARVPDRFGARRTATTALMVSASGLLLVFAWRGSLGLVLGSMLFATGQAFVFPSMLTLAVRGAPARERGSVVGTFTAFVDLGFLAGPLLMGFLADLYGYRGSFLGGSIVGFAGLVWLLARIRAEHHAAHPEPGPI
ncbi:MAG TPA: MFS transporter [Actinomycetota bacterium]|nr:MFS transporter [Actinomycetota bacterium]